jgi:processive 1,2-diacylglycerol beta-glucosyltransferase
MTALPILLPTTAQALGPIVPLAGRTGPSPRRVLVLTAGYGEGHNAAARNLAAALDAEAGPGTAHLADLFTLGSPRLNALARHGYLTAINRTPRLWSAFFAWIDRARPLPRSLWLLHREQAVLTRLLRETAPIAVCSTYPVYGFMLDALSESGELCVPHYNIVTDSISINSLWWLPRCTGWFVPNPDSAAVVLAAGIAPERIHTNGFPVPALFGEENPALQPPNLAAGHAPRVLYIINSGTRQAEATARRLLAESEWEITCTVGRNLGLRRRLQQLAARRRTPANILGWTDQIPRLLLTHHAVISKAGGATTQEAIAARCPMIVNQIVPGQEEGNCELLRRHGIGAYAPTPEAVITTLRNAFANQGAVWHDWRRGLEPLARPHAARDIARHVLAATAPTAVPATPAAAPALVPPRGHFHVLSENALRPTLPRHG